MHSSRSHFRPEYIRSSNSTSAPTLNLAEREFDSVMQKFGNRIVRHSDRPDIELRILTFLRRAVGPTTGGIAKEMGIDAAAAAIHLQALREAGRIWGQPVHGSEAAWHLSQKGRQFSNDHELLRA